jgi:AhpD family alkylhydroperoxidase
VDFGRKLYSLGEIYKIIFEGVRTAHHLSHSKKKNELDQEFIERIMLAVTEVNGCPLCSYAHTKMALEAGMTNEEIKNMLSGIMNEVPSEQMQAIMFAQHYAESRGNPSRESWEHIVESYGLSKSKAVLGAIRIIMMGNALGIPWSGFLSRIKGNHDDRTSLGYELSGMVIGSLMVPIATVHGLLSLVIDRSVLDFDK